MSAYIVDKAHIDALVTVAVLGPVTEPSAYNTGMESVPAMTETNRGAREE